MSIKISKKNNKKDSIVNNLRILRKYKEITLEQLSNNIKINFDTFRNYEQNYITPQINTLIKISNYFGISLDFLLLWDKTNYQKNLKFLKLAKKIDEETQTQERTNIEMTTKSFLDKIKSNNEIIIKQDNPELELTDNIHKNIKILREKKEYSQKQLAEMLEVNQSQIAHYQNKSIPPAEKLIKLSEIFNISIHALATGEKLFFDFQDRPFGNTILLADQLLPLEDQKIIIKLMENIIN